MNLFGPGAVIPGLVELNRCRENCPPPTLEDVVIVSTGICVIFGLVLLIVHRFYD